MKHRVLFLVLALAFLVGTTPGSATARSYEALLQLPADSTYDNQYAPASTAHYVYERVYATGSYIGSPWGDDISKWRDLARAAGYVINRLPAAGSVIILSEQRDSGSVGFVEQANNRDVIFAIWQDGAVEHRLLSYDQATEYRYIHPKSLYLRLEPPTGLYASATRDEFIQFIYRSYTGRDSGDASVWAESFLPKALLSASRDDPIPAIENSTSRSTFLPTGTSAAHPLLPSRRPRICRVVGAGALTPLLACISAAYWITKPPPLATGTAGNATSHTMSWCKSPAPPLLTPITGAKALN
jgi:surface antigen